MYSSAISLCEETVILLHHYFKDLAAFSCRVTEARVMGHHSALLLLSQVSLDRQRASSQNMEDILALMKGLSTTSC